MLKYLPEQPGEYPGKITSKEVNTMKNVIRAVKGTTDYYPEEMAIRTWLYEHVRKVSESFGYQEYEAPFLETLDLYAAKSGEEIVEKQSYVFEDRSGERITLRPELTPSLARMVAKKQTQLTFPLRWWSFGPFWRYERPQKGRGREFFQWNIDMIGERSPEGDAELATIAATFLKEIGLTPADAKILVNNRQLMDAETAALGFGSELRPMVYKLIDRRDKMSPKDWEAFATESGMTAKQIASLLSLLENRKLWEKSEEMQRFFKAADAFGASEYIEYAPQIIRGLDYYTGTVFEAWDTAGDFRSLFGGGRYDNLVSDVGGQPVSAVGFAVGNMVVTLLLEKLGRLPAVGGSPAKVFVTIFDEQSMLTSLALSTELRQAGINTATPPTLEKLGKQFKYADRIGAHYALVVGPDELAAGQVTVKNLSSGDQMSVKREELVDILHKELEHAAAS